MKYNIFHFDFEKGNKSFPLSISPPLSYQNILLNSPNHITNNPLSTTDTDNSLKNFTDIDIKISNASVIKDKFVKLLFDVYSENSCLCNYLLFEKNVDVFSKFDNIKKIKRLNLNDYFGIFIQYENLGLNIPFINDDYNMIYNTFNPSLSSMILLINPKNTNSNSKKHKTNSNNTNNKIYSQNNIALSYLKNGPIKIEFKESNPYFNRNTIESKLESIHKLLNKEQILIDDIVQKGSYFSILWSGANYNNINTSFLSFYSLDFNYVGSLIMRKNDYKWLSCFSIGNNNYKDFRNEYIEKIKKIDNLIESCYEINLKNINKENIYNYFAYDYIKYCYNL